MLTTKPSAYAANDESTETKSQNSTPNASSPEAKKRLKLDSFPSILHRMLSEEDLSEIITWLPHGHSWIITSKSRLVEEVIPKFFNHNNFKSFLRQVNGWGFIRINKGLDEGSYYHKSFLRGKPLLAKDIHRPPSFKANNRNQDPPNFRFLNEHKTNRLLSEFVQCESLNPSQSLRQLNSNHGNGQSSDATEGNLLGARNIPLDEYAPQAHISQVVLKNNVTQRMDSSALLFFLFEKRQQEIKTMFYMEEIKRLNLSILQSNSRNSICNSILQQVDTQRLLPNCQIVLSAREAMAQTEERLFGN